MSYSCCYVLVDNTKLLFFNQMMISLSSLRYTGFTGNVYIVTDNETANLLKSRCGELNELYAEIVAIDIEEGYTEKEKSRYLKTSLRKYIQGDVLFVDTDTIFASCLPDWISDDDIAMAIDRNGLDDDYPYRWHTYLFKKCGMDLQVNDRKFLNSGVIWMRDTGAVHSIFEKWHKLWKEKRILGIPYDQASLNYLWKHEDITINILDNRFNVQIGQRNFSPSLLCKALILHYYNIKQNDRVFLLNDPDVWKLDYRDERIQQIIHDPASAFSDCIWMKKDGLSGEYCNTKSFHLGLEMYKKHKRMFSLCEGFCRLIKKIRNDKNQF